MNAPARPRFFFLSAIAMAVVVFVGFSRTFFLSPLFPEVRNFIPPEPFFRVHGAVFSAWMLWLVSQTWLVQQKRTDLHRTFGWIGAAIAFSVVSLGIYGAALAARRPGGFIGVEFPPEQFFVIPFTAMLFFGTMVALAVVYRKQAQTHKRFMLLATVNLLEAAFIRFPMDFMQSYAPLTTFGAALLFVVALGVFDRRTTGKVHKVTLWGGIAIGLSVPTAFLLSGTSAWMSFAGWLINSLA